LKEPPTLREKFISDSVKELHRVNVNLHEEVKVLEKRFDFMQDEQARMVMEQQALIKAMKVWTLNSSINSSSLSVIFIPMILPHQYVHDK